MLPGRMSKPSGVFTIAEVACISSSSTSVMEARRSRFSTPLPIVALPCGSRSTSNTRFGVRARAAARFTEVVVLPTPPFWLATAMMRAVTARCPPVVRRCSVEAAGSRLCRSHDDEVPLGIETGHTHRMQLTNVPSRRQRGDLFAGHDALHCEQNATGSQEMAAGLQDRRERGERARGDRIE